MITRAAYAYSLELLTSAGIQWTDDMGVTAPVTILESDTPPPTDKAAGAIVAWTMFATNIRPLEFPREAPWKSIGYIRIAVLVPSLLGPWARIDVMNAVSDIYRAASPNMQAILYGDQSAEMPSDSDSGIYSVTQLMIAWEYDEAMPGT